MQITIDAQNLHYKDLNQLIHQEITNDNRSLVLENINGHRYIANALKGKLEITIEGVPGNDLAVFMDGPSITVHGNVQDGAANTMNDGVLSVHGSAGDVLGYGMRGGQIYIRDNVGYRAGIHMKEYGASIPTIVVGGITGDFLGEYMAGGCILVLNLNNEPYAVGRYCATGMHGGKIIIRGAKEKYSSRIKAPIADLDEEEFLMVNKLIQNYEDEFEKSAGEIAIDSFFKVQSPDARPYKRLYTGV